MIIAYNALSVRPGVFDGAATFTLNLIRHLPAVLDEHELFVVVRAGESRVPEAPNLRVERVPLVRNAAGRIAAETLWLSHKLRRVGAAALVSPNESLPLGPPCPVVVVAQNLVYHRDEVTSFYGATLRDRLVSYPQAGYYRSRMKRAFERATAIIAVSETTAEMLAHRAGLDRSKTAVVYEGSDSFLLSEPEGPLLPEPRVLVVSSLAPYKNLEATIEVFSLLRVTRPELVLDVVGSDWRGYERVLEQIVRERGLTSGIRFRGSVDARELARLYSTSLLLLHLSECESFGLPAVEALHFGLPVVIGNRSSLPEVCGGAALVINPRRPAEAAERISSFLEDEPGQRELVGRGYKRAAELTWRRSAEGIADVLLFLLHQRRTSAPESRC